MTSCIGFLISMFGTWMCGQTLLFIIIVNCAINESFLFETCYAPSIIHGNSLNWASWTAVENWRDYIADSVIAAFHYCAFVAAAVPGHYCLCLKHLQLRCSTLHQVSYQSPKEPLATAAASFYRPDDSGLHGILLCSPPSPILAYFVPKPVTTLQCFVWFFLTPSCSHNCYP